MLLTNATLYTKDFRFAPNSHICVKDDRIAAVVTNADATEDPATALGEETIDAHGLLVIPGLVDLHFHGSVGHDFMEGTEEALDAIAKYQAKSGILAICPATMTMSEEDIRIFCGKSLLLDKAYSFKCLRRKVEKRSVRQCWETLWVGHDFDARLYKAFVAYNPQFSAFVEA